MAANKKDPATVIDGTGPGSACLAASGLEIIPSFLTAQGLTSDSIEAAMRSLALRKRVAAHGQPAANASFVAGQQGFRSPQARRALHLAGIADELDAAVRR